jgi:hypothetical protein
MPSPRGPKPDLASPDAYFITPPQPPVDLASIQRELGALNEAVKTLKEQSKAQGEKLEAVTLDIHSAKAALKFLRWVVGVIGALLAIFLAAYLQHLFGGK